MYIRWLRDVRGCQEVLIGYPGVLVEFENGPENQGRCLVLPMVSGVRWHMCKGILGVEEI